MSDPQFSVIIPAFNVQGYLRQAVMSVALDESVEVLVVDDRSTDGTAVLADELEGLFDTVRVIRPPQNVGLGRARNLGMSEARGEYIVFIDGDDYLVAGALDRLRAAISDHNPDVVVFGYSRLYANGVAEEGVMREPLQAEQPFTAAERTQILDVLNVAWNKAYRRSFLEATGIEFPVGYYEDIPWTYPLLASAGSIIGVDEPLYMYRQRASGSILRSTDARHLEIVDQFDRLMASLEELEIPDAMRAEIFTRGFRNIVTLTTSRRNRIPRNLHREFYTKARRIVKTHEPAGYTLPTSGDKWKLMRLVWSMDYNAFSMRLLVIESLNRIKSGSRSALRAGKTLLRRIYHNQRFYRLHRRFSRVDGSMVVLENLWGLSPRLNCLAIDREIRRTHPEMRIVWSVNHKDRGGVPAHMEYVVTGSHQYYRALASAKYFFLDVNLPAWWRKRPGQVFTELHHGTPLKLMGMEERGQEVAWFDGLLKRCQQWDYSLVSNSYSAEVWKHSYPVSCETLEYGYPRNDVLVDAGIGACAEARERVGVDADARVILYVPTFRERDWDSISMREIEEIAGALDDGDVLLMRGHYLAGRERGADLDPAIMDVTDYASIEDLYLAADVLITDYSSAMFDFANLGRPIVIFAPDWEQYRHERGTYFDITVDAPGSVVHSAADLASCLSARDYESSSNQAQLLRFQAIFCEFDTGHAARDVVARVIDGVRRDDIPRAARPSLTTWQMERKA
ncbi:bifunctional glycosyltransferase/CDP-glycerol:glycerophosphate glycerophosphotransferase [Demequina aurantiaca]|uniref:bifunctional glycosyltransferase/CDP-glycerol:glycerophosphate glycerophosphotransferase n=1 Tax=Demequina aurantiaca TaxID=676200 RepID=UPI003D3373D1